ncbi:MAG: alpha/beta fold hydrolase [Candidatus Thorarchaeota archaeon]
MQEGKEYNLKLNDGRTIAFYVLGNSNKESIFYFHGWPGTRLEIQPFESIVKKLDFQLVGIDRPGSGKSEFQRKRKVSDWPKDIKQIADYLKISKFSIIGLSTGGMYAIETLKQLPNLVNKICLVSAVPYFKIKYPKPSFRSRVIKLTHYFPLLSKSILRIISDLGIIPYRRNKQKAFQKFLKKRPVNDRITMTKQGMKEWFLDSYIPDLLKSSKKGLSYDIYLLLKEQATVDPTEAAELKHQIYLFHGTNDTVVPMFASIQQDSYFPNSELILFDNEGHSTIYNHMEEIVEKLLSR